MHLAPTLMFFSLLPSDWGGWVRTIGDPNIRRRMVAWCDPNKRRSVRTCTFIAMSLFAIHTWWGTVPPSLFICTLSQEKKISLALIRFTYHCLFCTLRLIFLGKVNCQSVLSRSKRKKVFFCRFFITASAKCCNLLDSLFYPVMKRIG